MEPSSNATAEQVRYSSQVRYVRALAQSRDPLPAGPRVMQPQALHVDDLEARALDLRQGLAESREIAVREDVAVQELGLAGALPVKVVDDPVVQVETTVLEPGAHAGEEGGIVRDADVLDHAAGGDLLVAGARRQIPVIEVLDAAAVLEPFRPDTLGGVSGLRPRQGYPVCPHAVVLRRPERQAAPPAPDVEQALAGRELELATHEVELVALGLLQLAVGIPVVRAGVDHERIEEQRVELVGHVVVMGDRLRVRLAAAPSHDATSRIPKMRPRTTWRRVAPVRSAARTRMRAHTSGSFASWRPSQPASPEP